jgi:Xaa-Pro aminopeptidase
LKPQALLDPVTSQADFQQRLQRGRLLKLRTQLRRFDCAAGLFYDPINIRYATDVSNMQVYSLHNPCRYVFVATEGPVILFDFRGCEHLSAHSVVVDELRAARSWYHFNSGPHADRHASQWAAEIDDLMRQYASGNRRLAIDKLDPRGTEKLQRLNYEIVEGQEVAHFARLVKSDEEILVLRDAVSVCQYAIDRMQQASEPGVSEQAIWSILHQINIEYGGEWIETRLLTSGPRTNPWYQECSSRSVEAGDMISLDSDMVGPQGYSADISRSWVVGTQQPSAEQCKLYNLAHQQVTRNCDLFRAGRGFRDIGNDAWRLPEPYTAFEQPAIAHGIGLCNEYPLIMHREYFDREGFDGELEAGMVFCVESYVGAPGGREGVKLEQQILVTENGHELLSDLAFDANLLR